MAPTLLTTVEIGRWQRGLNCALTLSATSVGCSACRMEQGAVLRNHELGHVPIKRHALGVSSTA